MTAPPLDSTVAAPSPLLPVRVLDEPKSEPAPIARAWIWFTVVGLVVTGLVLVLPSGLLSDSLYVALGLATAVALVAGVRLHRPQPALPWLMMAAAQVLWVGGDAVYAAYGEISGLGGSPVIGDLLYLSAYPIFAAAFLVLIVHRRREFELVAFLDSATVTAGLGLLAWVLLANPALGQAADSSTMTTVITVGYPLGDILLIGGLIRLLATTGGRSRSLRLLLLAAGLLITADVVNATMSLHTDAGRAWIGGLWLASYVAWGAAALHPSMTEVTRPVDRGEEVRFTWVRLTAFGVATLTAPGVLAFQTLAGRAPDVWAVVVGSVLMFSLVVLRMSFTLRAIARIVGERTELQETLSHRAAHDALTGLTNRSQLLLSLEAAIGRTQRTEGWTGLLFVDLDGFKAVNDAFGHQAGDTVLRVVSDRLLQLVRSGDVVARLGGDEFVVLLEPIDTRDAALAVAERLVATVSRPIDLGRLGVVKIGASVGVSATFDGQVTPETLLHEADTAAYRAKSGGKGRAEVYDAALRAEVASRVSLEDAIAAAIVNDELVLLYQPIVRVGTREVASYEALVRWDRPGYGMVQPDEFIPLAEESHLICDLDTWALQRACLDFASVPTGPDGTSPRVGVNISGRHLNRARVIEDVAVALARARLPASRLIVELTETVLVDDAVAIRHLTTLREGGVSVSIDDFGTGYSAISRLGTLPIDTVKIDRRFVDPDSTSAPILLQLMVEAAHAHGLPVVVEGIEHEHQLETLSRLGCESAQGFMLGRPGPLAEVLARGVAAPPPISAGPG